MPNLTDKKLTQEVALAQIEQVLCRGRPNDPPAYTLILGAGASYGSVPTAKQMIGLPGNEGVIHPQAIPVFLRELELGSVTPGAAHAQIVTDFWKSFEKTNADLFQPQSASSRPNTRITLNNGLPTLDSVALAYQALFAQDRSGGINTADGARSYLRTITLPQNGQIELNGTHFFLASLLSLQAREGEMTSDSGPFYIGRRPFARTLFTTNFDPLIQISLQLFQLLYYMTDRPETLAADALYTDDQPTIHLFYAHGSIHRPFLANSNAEIEHLRDRNAQNLAGYLGRHGVIILGYSGWDDCLLRALKQTHSFANNLYWLARSEASLTTEVREFLTSRPNAFWVEIADGGQWMAALHRRLSPGMPFTELLKNPIPFLRRRLEQVALGSITPDASASKAPYSGKAAAQSENGIQIAPESFRLQVVDLLIEAETQFEQLSSDGGLTARLKTLEHQADLSYGSNQWKEAIELYTQIISDAKDLPETKVSSSFRRGYCYGQVGDFEKAIADFSTVIEIPEAPVEAKSGALLNRGYVLGKVGRVENEISDYTSVITLEDAPIADVASALFNRALTYDQLGDHIKEIADYTAVIGLPNSPTKRVVTALVNRAVTYGELGDIEKELADYDTLIALAGISAETLARALINRGGVHRRLGNGEKEIADYIAAKNLPGAPLEQVVSAHRHLGQTYRKLGNTASEVAELTAVIGLAGISIQQMSEALLSRAVAFGRLDDYEKETADYLAIIGTSGASIDTIAMAHRNLGLAHARRGKTLEAIAEYSEAIRLNGAPIDQVAKALINRGAAYEKLGDIPAAISDYSALINLDRASVDQIALALLGRGDAFRGQGNLAGAIGDYTRVTSLAGVSNIRISSALINRGLAQIGIGDRASAISDFDRVIGSDDAPPELVKRANELRREYSGDLS